MLAQWRAVARQLKTETLAIYLSVRDPRTPWYAKLAGGMVVAYAFSPLDLIPDFVPVLGYVDDVVLLPLGIWLTLRLIPSQVIAENRARARSDFAEGKPVNRGAAAVILLIWVGAIILSALAVWRMMDR